MFGKKSKDELIIESTKLQVQCELYQKQIADLMAMVKNLQDALIAKEAPRAYDDLSHDRRSAGFDPTAHLKKSKENTDLVHRYLDALENGELYNEGGGIDELLALYSTSVTEEHMGDPDEG